MDTIINHNVAILNVKNDIINKLYLACKKESYGENISYLLKESFIKVKLIRKIEAFDFNNPIGIIESDLPKMYEVLNFLCK